MVPVVPEESMEVISEVNRLTTSKCRSIHSPVMCNVPVRSIAWLPMGSRSSLGRASN